MSFFSQKGRLGLVHSESLENHRALQSDVFTPGNSDQPMTWYCMLCPLGEMELRLAKVGCCLLTEGAARRKTCSVFD